MALKLSYLTRETGTNLWRNITLTLASMLTVAVSLSLVGAALLLRQGVQNATARWQGGIEFIVWMNPEATGDQISAMGQSLEENPGIEDQVYVDQDEAYEEFQNLFAQRPEMIETVTPENLPSSYRVVPSEPDAQAIQQLGELYEDEPGVYDVTFAFDTVETMQRLSRIIANGILAIAFALLIAASLLILNTIRMAMFARRREIEVMKLVGATNWFIRIPFMLEGLIQGVIGAVVSIGVVWALNGFFQRRLASENALAILQSFVVDRSEVVGTSVLLLVVGVVVGTVGSGIAVSRFLDI
ncbi:MAG: permease-like cell division protein FtsX [Actinomycetota bacterium]|nr:permease-like cell division protein FtsX [Actinomycetota bacterium]